jgi:hypothetical protein
MNRESQLAIFAIVTALGVLGVIAVESISMPQQQQAYAAGCPVNTPAINASKGCCFGH